MLKYRGRSGSSIIWKPTFASTAGGLGLVASPAFVLSYDWKGSLNTKISQTIPIYDISCPIPDTPLPQAKGLPWLRLLSEYSKILSRTYENLFSVNARHLSKKSIHAASDRVFEELESWRLSIPEEFRPGLPMRTHKLGSPMTTFLAIQLHFYYYNVRIGALRVVMQTCSDDTERYLSYREALAETAEGIADLVHLIPLEAFVSPW